MGVLAQLWRPQVGHAGEGGEFGRERSSWLLSGVEQESFNVRVSGFTKRDARRNRGSPCLFWGWLGAPQGPAGVN